MLFRSVKGARRRRCISAWPAPGYGPLLPPGAGGEEGSWLPGWPCGREMWRGAAKPGCSGVPATTQPPPAPSSAPAVAPEPGPSVTASRARGATHVLTPRPPLGPRAAARDPEHRCSPSPTKLWPPAAPRRPLRPRGSRSDCGARQPATRAKQGWPRARARPRRCALPARRSPSARPAPSPPRRPCCCAGGGEWAPSARASGDWVAPHLSGRATTNPRHPAGA